MILSIEHRQMFEDVVIAAQRLLALHSSGTVVPGIVDQDLAVMEADADDKVVALYPAHHGLHLFRSASHQLIIGSSQVPPARELSVEVEVVHVGPQLGLVTVWVDGGQKVNLCCVEQPADVRVSVPAVTEITRQTCSHFLYNSLQQLLYISIL